MRAQPAILLRDLSWPEPGSPAEQVLLAHAEHAISVEIATPERFASIEREWRDLTTRALAANVFMEPSIVAAAAFADGVEMHVLLAWAAKETAGPVRLVGAWAFACRRPTSLVPLTVLKSPVHPHGCLGIPVLDADIAADVLMRMLDTVVQEPDLPKLVEINSLDDAGPIAALFADVLARRGSRHVRLEPRRRPQLVKGLAEAAPLSSSREKALRQKRRRLDKRGQLSCTTHQAPEEIRAALEEFLALEIAGWKGKAIERGHAIRRFPANEAFFRAAIEGLATRGLAKISALRSDGKPVAMQITVQSGSTAFTWKSAYDEAQRDCAPGILMLQEVTAALLADPAIAVVDSCNHRDDGYMAEFWSGRKPVLDMVLDARRGMTPAFLLLGGAERARQRLQVEARRTHRALRSAKASVSSFIQSKLQRLRDIGARPPADESPTKTAPARIAKSAPAAKPGRERSGRDAE